MQINQRRLLVCTSVPLQTGRLPKLESLVYLTNMALQLLRWCGCGGSAVQRMQVSNVCRRANSHFQTASGSRTTIAFQSQPTPILSNLPQTESFRLSYSTKTNKMQFRSRSNFAAGSSAAASPASKIGFGERLFHPSQSRPRLYASCISATSQYSLTGERTLHCMSNHRSKDKQSPFGSIASSMQVLQDKGSAGAATSWHCMEGRRIHTSQGRHAPPIALVVALKSLGKAAAVLTGRSLRNHWRSHPKHKHKSTRERLHENRRKIVAGLAGLLGFGIGFYFYHIDYTPLTNRPRFIMFNTTQFNKIVDAEFEMHMKEFEGSFVPVSHPVYKVISDIVGRLVKGNHDVAQIRNQTWTIHVVDKKLKNAFVLPNGHIFVFTGILEATDNVEQLGSVLAHEMAHVVLKHSAEMSSFFEFFDFFMIVILTALWAFLPNDGIALVATWFKNRVIQLLLHMPYNRSLETEADEVGLMLAAKSCFDVRECKAFWEAMDAAQTANGDPEPIEFLSTHPSHQSRAENIEAILPRALRVREYCECPALPVKPLTMNPRRSSGKAITSPVTAA